MKKLRLHRISALLSFLLLVTGCSTTAVVQPADPRIAGDPTDAAFVTPTATLARLYLAIDSSATANAPAQLATDIKNQLAGSLNLSRFYITQRDADVTVRLQVASELLDQSGNYFSYRGTTNAAIVRNFDQSVLGSSYLQSRGERTLGETMALQALSQRMSADAAAWINDNLTLDAVGLAANDISLTIPRSFSFSDYIQRFIQESSATPGVTSCTLIAQDTAARSLTFRVVYYPQELPEGILNRLALNPNLNLRR